MKKWITYLIVAIIIASVVGVTLAWNYMPRDEEEVKVVEMGDTVTVHYTGWLRDERIYDNRRVFDTSLERIHEETTVTFQERQRGDPFAFTVGSGVIDGWSENVIGLREGQTILVDIPPEKAYDTRTEELIYQVDRVERIPMHETIRLEKFVEDHGIFPKINMVVQDAFWTWNKVVIGVEHEHVDLRHEPDVGSYYNAYAQGGLGWSSKVISLDSSANSGVGEIVVEHHAELRTVVRSNHLQKHDARFGQVLTVKRNAGQSSTPEGVVIETGDKIIIDFNEEVAGRTLTFRISVLVISKG